VPPPPREGRIDVLNVHLKSRRHSGLDLHELAYQTPGYTGAMLANLCNLAAIFAARNGRDTILPADFQRAIAQEEAGMNTTPHQPDVLKRVALLEAATAVISTLLPELEDVEMITAQPAERRRLGKTVLKSNEPRQFTRLFTRRYLEVRCARKTGMLWGMAMHGLDHLLRPENMSVEQSYDRS
jgi:cell division protease FtsH